MYTSDNVNFFVREVVATRILCVAVECEAKDLSGNHLLSRVYLFRAFDTPEGEDPYELAIKKNRDHIIERMLWHLNND